jgi:hypothetical protein
MVTSTDLADFQTPSERITHARHHLHYLAGSYAVQEYAVRGDQLSPHDALVDHKGITFTA